jgi:hypothetical protein
LSAYVDHVVAVKGWRPSEVRRERLADLSPVLWQVIDAKEA